MFEEKRRNLQQKKGYFEKQFQLFESQKHDEFRHQIRRIEKIQRAFRNHQQRLAERQ